MNCDVKLTAEEFKVLHNGLWELGRFCQFKEIEEIVERIRKVALKSAYEQEERAFKTKMDCYQEFQEQNQLRSIWGVYELAAPGGFAEEHPYQDAKYIVYDTHWGDSEVVQAIEGSTWADLYHAADKAILRSNDNHHIFIELFTPINDKPGHLRLTTGS